ncbi:MAG: quinolinate synthase NadA [Candidatus Odinarchaeia archaeon]
MDKNISEKELQEKILSLKEEKNAVLLVHNYQRINIQEIADFIGDSLELAVRASKLKDKSLIVFCGVDFMAETAAILNPDKKILIPDKNARCPMAAMLPASLVVKYKKEHPNAQVVLYVNTLAEAKAEADVLCTSANADEIVAKMDADEILFGPDCNLAWYVQQRVPDKKIIPIPETGYCYVHKQFSSEVLLLKEEHPDAILMVHPECDPELQKRADFVGSTGKMYRFAKESPHKKFIVGTEVGLVERMRREILGKEFIPAKSDAICKQMKLHILEKVYNVLKNESNVVRVPDEIAAKAKNAIKKMMEFLK